MYYQNSVSKVKLFQVIYFRLATVATVAVKPTGIVKRIMALDVSANAQSDEKWVGVGQ